MKDLTKKFLLGFADIIGKTRYYTSTKLRSSYKPILSGIFSFCLVFCGIYITTSRNIAIKHIKKNINQTINYLNEMGIDVAYDNIEFNSLMFNPLVKIDNLKIYNTSSLNDWAVKFETIKAYPNIIGTKRLRFKSTSGGTFYFNEFSSNMTSDETFLDIISDANKLKELIFHAENINIKDFAKIEKIAFLLQSTNHSEIASFTTPSFTSLFEVNNVKINGLVDYPLSSNMKLIYAKANIMGRIIPEDFIMTSLESWLREGGFIDVPNLIIQWEPLTLVGRGNINFNEEFSPRINFNTSSKGMLRLIKDLQQREFLESSNFFIANILLRNKAYKINPEDEELTISTPIGYADKKITVENLVIKDFTK